MVMITLFEFQEPEGVHEEVEPAELRAEIHPLCDVWGRRVER